MTAKEAIAEVRRAGILLESARGPIPSLAGAVAGGPFRGSYWAHPKGNEIFLCTRAVRKSPAVLVCRLVNGNVTYVHRRLWPALVCLASAIGVKRLAAINEIHTASGKHIVTNIPYPRWVTPSIRAAAKALGKQRATEKLGALRFALVDRRRKKVSRSSFRRPAK